MSAVWLFKSEPETFSFECFQSLPGQTTFWDGVRNYQARNLLRDLIGLEDTVLFYHSSCKTPAIVGLAEVVRGGEPDPTQFDPTSAYFDPEATRAHPRWFGVTLRAKRALEKPLTLAALRGEPTLVHLPLLQRGSRLSVQPVDKTSWAWLKKQM